MQRHPGQVFGELAYAHPFLDGNGRTILLVHMELCARAGFHLAWEATTRDAFLNALTEELGRPGDALDDYLQPFRREGAADPALRSTAVLNLARGTDRQPDALQNDAEKRQPFPEGGESP